MSETNSFLKLVMDGKVLISEIDDFVDKWHGGQSTDELYEYLGMTFDEYSLWVADPDTLAIICTARLKGQPVAQAVNDNIPELRMAARSGDAVKLKSLEAWLRRQGVID